jgi:tagatose 1,6-diphosphate aldolase
MIGPLTIAKMRGLQQITNNAGAFVICALEGHELTKRWLEVVTPDSATFDVLVTVIRDLTEYLAPDATAVLLDPVYGAAQAIASGALPGNKGLLVSLEDTGGERGVPADSDRPSALLPGWGVDKVKRMGGSAAKLQIAYRPDRDSQSSQQREMVRRVVDDCAWVDIPFLLQVALRRTGDQTTDPVVLAASQPELAVQTASDLTRLGIEVLAIEFPADRRFDHDEGRLREVFQRLDEASQAPWVLVSGTTPLDDFVHQTRVACQAGASGCLIGPGIWREVFHLADQDRRRQWLSTTGRDRLRRLHDVAGEYGRPWWWKWGEDLILQADVPPDWYRHY